MGLVISVLDRIVENYDDNEDQCNIDISCLLNLFIQIYPLSSFEKYIVFLTGIVLRGQVYCALCYLNRRSEIQRYWSLSIRFLHNVYM